MPEPPILTDPNQMLLRALAAKDAEIERLKGMELWFTEAVDALHAENGLLRAVLEQVVESLPEFTEWDAEPLREHLRLTLERCNGA